MVRTKTPRVSETIALFQELYGANPAILELVEDVIVAGHTIEPLPIPGLWRVDDRDEMDTAALRALLSAKIG